MGQAAVENPDFTFLTYHSEFETSVTEGPYNAEQPEGIDRLIRPTRRLGCNAIRVISTRRWDRCGAIS